MLDLLSTTVAGVAAALEHWVGFVMLAGLWLAVAGRVGRGMGLANLFRDDARLLNPRPEDSRFAILWASPAFWSQLTLTLFAGVVWILASETPDCVVCVWPPEGGAPQESRWLRLAAAAAVAGGLFLRAGWITVTAMRPDGVRAGRGPVAREMTRRALGFVVGLGLLLLAWSVAGALPESAVDLLPFGLDARWSAGLVWFYAIAVLVLAAALAPGRILPCVSLAALLTVILLIGGVFERFGEGWGEIAALAIILWIVWANAAPFKLRLPGFSDAAYAAPVDPNGDAPLPGHPGAVDPVDALQAWLDRVRAEKGPDHRPKLAILCTSGGAYRASFWTALLLDHLRARSGPGCDLEGLADSVRLVTGASGGMVAGAYFAAMAAEGAEDDVLTRLEADIEAFQREPGPYRRNLPIPRDSLTAVAQRIVRGDLPRVFLPGRPATDRGRVLDRQWRTLAVSFADLAPAERDGRAPSLIISPMLVESGAPAFLSNLDLSAMRRRSLGLEDAETDINRESVELFEAFPDAWSAMPVATAVRLNATFPYVSPAVSLPTRPKRRVVDAGYYDNYGVDLATAFLLEHRVKDWILRHCSGVAVLQARAFPSGQADAPKGSFARAFQWLTSPAEGVFRARSSSQMFRNNQQLREVMMTYDLEAGESFVETFAFEAAADASMSWYLPADELAAMAQLLPDGGAPAPEADPGVAAGGSEAERRAATVRAQESKLVAELARLRRFWRGESSGGAPIG